MRRNVLDLRDGSPDGEHALLCIPALSLISLSWAIKEAAIKAHSRRRLFLREVSILKEPAQDSDAGDAHFYEVPGKPQVLIDPPTALILMDDHVARLRGLRCVRSPLAPPQFPHASQGSPSPAPPRFSDHQRSPVAVDAGRMHRRRRRVEMRDRRLADASLSHDGDYAVAICQALDEAEAGALDGLTDDGNGPPLHEAEYGDLGFCSEDKPGPPLGHDG